jgi:N6-adenosine-specific RNA methylase IME4
VDKRLARQSSKLPVRVAADRVIAKLSEAARALEYATTIHQAKVIADVAAAQELFAHRQRLGDAVTGYAHEIKIYALAKLGELLRPLPKVQVGKEPGPGRGNKRYPAGAVLEKQTLDELGVSKKTSAIAQQLADLPAPVRDAIAKRETTITKARREHARTHMRPADLPEGKFRVLYADPPWHYGNSGVISESDNYGRAARHYPSMTIAELSAMAVKSHVADNAVLFLWVTSPLLAECWPVIAAWGFTYKASIVWDKVAHNFGSYVSVRHEFLLICTRGSCLPDHPTPMPDSVVSVPRSEKHSEKPAEFRALIDRLYDGDARAKLELFAREGVDGWTTWGNELEGVA